MRDYASDLPSSPKLAASSGSIMALGEQLGDPGVAGGAADSESVSLPPGTVWRESSESTTIGKLADDTREALAFLAGGTTIVTPRPFLTTFEMDG